MALSALVLFVVVASATILAASRLVTRISRRFQILIFLVAFLLPARALLTDRVLAPIDAAYRFAPLDEVKAEREVVPVSPGILNDVYTQMIPWRAAVRFALDHGEWPLWNPFIQSGDLLAGSMQAAPYYPWNVASLLLSLADSFAFVAGLNLLAAVLGGFLFLRELRLREISALAGGTAWAFSSFLLFWLQWPLGQGVGLLPLLLLATRRIVRTPIRSSWLLLTLTLLLVLLGGHPESMFHLVAVALVWGALELLATRVDLSRLARRLGLAALAGAVALGFAAFWLGPFLEALPQSTEHLLRHQMLATSERDRPLGESKLLFHSQVVPFVFGVYGVETSTMQLPFTLPATGYCGGVAFAVGALGLFLSRRRVRFLFAAMAALGVAIGVDLAPLAGWLAKLPLFDIALNERLIFLCAFGITGLVGLGVEEMIKNGEWAATARRWLRPELLVLAGAFLVLVLALVVLWPGMRGIGLSDGFLRARSAMLLLPPLIVLLAAPFRRSRALTPSLIVPLLLLQRLAELGHLHRTFPKQDFYPDTPLVRSFPRHGEPFRIAGLGAALRPNSAAMWRLEDIRGYQAMTFRRLIETRRLVGAELSIMTFHPERIDYPFADFMNVRFAIVPRGAPPSPASWRLHYEGATASVFENLKALDRANLPGTVYIGSDTAALGNAIAGSERYDDRAWIEPWTLPAPKEPAALTNAKGTVATRRDGLGYRLSADLDREGWITFAETAWRGWQARIGETELPLGYANHAFLAIRAPAGKHEIRLRYFPDGFRWGLAISGATALLLVVGLVVFRSTGRRAPA